MNPSRPTEPLRFLLFDLDGTLVDTLADIAGSVNHMLLRLGMAPLSLEDVRSYVGHGVERLIARSLGDGLEAEVERQRAEEGLAIFREHYDAHCLDNSVLYPGAREMLDRFADRKLGIVSNKPERYVKRILEALDAEQYFGIALGGDSVEERKPSPLMVRTALGRFNLAPDEGILVGDMSVDVETGRAAGVFTVAVLGGFGSRRDLEASGPGHLAVNLYEAAWIFR